MAKIMAVFIDTENTAVKMTRIPEKVIFFHVFHLHALPGMRKRTDGLKRFGASLY